MNFIDLMSPSVEIYEDKRYKIFCKGTVFNRDEITKKYGFQPSIFSCFLLDVWRKGTNILGELDGQFAVAVCDKKLHTLYLFRDFAGQVPLYYSKIENTIVFSDELERIACSKFVSKEIDKVALAQYFQLSYISAPRTIYSAIKKVPPASVVTINESILVSKYYQLSFSPDADISYEEAKNRVRAIINRAVSSRIPKNGRVGVLLSGGIDSTIIAGSAMKQGNSGLTAYTVSFENSHYDEGKKAQIVATSLGIRHEIFDLSYREGLESATDIVNKIDEPYADSSLIALNAVTKYVSTKEDVLLTGDGGDELFCGYSKYLISYYSRLYMKVPRFFRECLFEPLIAVFPDKTALSRKVKKVVRNSEKDWFDQYINLLSLGFKGNELKRLFSCDYSTDYLDDIREHFYALKNSGDYLNQQMYSDFKVVLEGDMFMKSYYAKKNTPVGMFAPLISTDVVSLAYSMSTQYKIQKTKQKRILKDAFNDIIPDEVLHLTKQGFGVPISDWFRNGLKNELCELTSRKFVVQQGIFNFDYLDQIINEHCTYKENRAIELWAYFVFQKWYANHF